MKALLTVTLVAGSLIAGIASATAAPTSQHFAGQPDWAQSAFLGGTQR